METENTDVTLAVLHAEMKMLSANVDIYRTENKEVINKLMDLAMIHQNRIATLESQLVAIANDNKDLAESHKDLRSLLYSVPASVSTIVMLVWTVVRDFIPHK